jgi:hypothetical protein
MPRVQPWFMPPTSECGAQIISNEEEEVPRSRNDDDSS